MRFLLIPRPAPRDAAAGPSCDPREQAFDEDLFLAYMKFNEEMAKAGVLVASEGISPDDCPVLVTGRKGRRSVTDGPFTETKELVAGFFLIEVKSREEAVSWALKCPIGGGHEDLEIRQLTAISSLPEPLRALIAKHAPTWSAPIWKS